MLFLQKTVSVSLGKFKVYRSVRWQAIVRFWWGEIVELSHEDIEEMVHQAELGRDFLTAFAALVGTLPGAQAYVAGGAGFLQVASQISQRIFQKKDKGNGVVIKRIYLLPGIGKIWNDMADQSEGNPFLRWMIGEPGHITLEIESR